MEFNNRKYLGKLGESLAKDYLIRKGFDIIDQNFLVFGGEIDIIARHEEVIVFIEVKTRLKDDLNFHPEDSIGSRKKTRLIRTAQIWLAKNINKEIYWQIDVISIIISKHGKIEKLEHFENVIY